MPPHTHHFHVAFTISAPTLTHGDSIRVCGDHPAMGADDPSRAITLHTTPSSHPHYETSLPIAMASSLPTTSSLGTETPLPTLTFTYKYALYVGGKFSHFEATPTPRTVTLTATPAQLPPAPPAASSDKEDGEDGEDKVCENIHDPVIAVISDTLTTDCNPTPPPRPVNYVQDSEFMSSPSSKYSGFRKQLDDYNRPVSPKASAAPSKDTKVTFESPEPVQRTKSEPVTSSPAPAGRGSKASTNSLESTDGVIVVSIFLPIVLDRDGVTGQWSADWDHENLLSMSSHMRVTRVGTVKWRGWGNFGSKDADWTDPDSPEMGVPVSERGAVEQVLARFNCVPVWVDAITFKECYNDFCKGVLWPIMHNVVSIYNKGGVDADGGLNPSSPSDPNPPAPPPTAPSESTSMYEPDTGDVAPSPIHGDGGRQGQLWSAYTQVNQAFNDTIIQCFNEGDLIWIHGFHLLVLPSMLSRKVGSLSKIGLFLHTPFPSSEIFRALWCREDLLRGMLNADQIGFHLYEYARHFLTCCRRLLGLTNSMTPDTYGGHILTVDTNGRNVTVTSIHAGVDEPLINKVLSHEDTAEKVKSIREQFKGKVIMVAIDRLENLKGAPLKLLGLERFLDKRPEYCGKLVLVLVGISAFEREEDYLMTKSEVLRLTQRVNAKYPDTVQFQECPESDMRLPQRMAILRAADIAIVTSLRDGLNRLPLEFAVAHHKDAFAEGIKNYADYDEGVEGSVRIRPGICILSEFASCARVMRGSIHINPWKITEIACAIGTALSMDVEEHRRRLKYDAEYVCRVTTQRWALAVLLDLKGVKKSMDHGQYTGAGIGLGFRMLGMNTGFYSLDRSKVAKSYRSALNRLIMFDYGGTLLNDEGSKRDAVAQYGLAKKMKESEKPTAELVQELTQLCSDPRNTVFVVSGKERSALNDTLGGIPNLGLAAEHGMFYSFPSGRVGFNQPRRWEVTVTGQDRSWRATALSVMEVYTSRTHGSYIEQTESKILWQYRDADPEFGLLQSKELEDHLQSTLKSFNVDILRGGENRGGAYIEIRPKGVNKGLLLATVLGIMGQSRAWDQNAKPDAGFVLDAPPVGGQKKIDFALIIGDDKCDEPMFSTMRSVGGRAKKKGQKSANPRRGNPQQHSHLVDSLSPSVTYYTCTVGKKPSEAANFLNDVDEVHELILSLNKISTRERKFYSSADLTSMRSGAGGSPPKQGQANLEIPPHLQAQFEKLSGLGLSATTQTISAGITRSLSMNSMTNKAEAGHRGMPSWADGRKVSTTLKDFLQGVAEEDDEPMEF